MPSLQDTPRRFATKLIRGQPTLQDEDRRSFTLRSASRSIDAQSNSTALRLSSCEIGIYHRSKAWNDSIDRQLYFALIA